MKIVVACDSYKHALTAKEVGACIIASMKSVLKTATFVNIPMADGGEGSIDLLSSKLNAKKKWVKVRDPLLSGKKINTYYRTTKDTALIEMAKSNGIELLSKEKRNALLTSSYGLGEVISDALDKSIKNIIIAIGGSSTNDGAIGALQALGVQFFDQQKKLIATKHIAQNIDKIASLDTSMIHKNIKHTNIKIACDVNNPLYGKTGATMMYGQQKGLSLENMKFLDKSLKHFAKISSLYFDSNLQNSFGAGAAGGSGYGLATFLNAKITSGIDMMLETLEVGKEIEDAHLVITGEGEMDTQSGHNKVALGIAKMAKRYGVPVIAIVGATQKGYEAMYRHGIEAIFDITKILSLKFLKK